MRWFRRLRGDRDPDPGTPHEFRPIDDPGLGALAAGGPYAGAASGGPTQLATTDNFIRKSRCGVPGCGKERSDPIHRRGKD